MEICGICGKILRRGISKTHLKEHNVFLLQYLTQFPDAKVNKGGVKEGHPCYYSIEYLGEERFNQIEEKRKAKISQTLRLNPEGCRKGCSKCHEVRKQKPNYGFTEEGLRKQSETMRTNRKNGICKTWNKGLTKFDDERIMKMALDRTIYFDKIIDRKEFTKEIRLSIGKRDNFQCQNCGGCSNLVIHHEDLSKNNNNLDNLILLCRGCHARLHNPLQFNQLVKV